jgi:uncharacterized protein (TIGR04255 family)
MADKASALPDYNNPPINEVVFGIQFQKIDKFETPHVGFLWETLGRKNFPQYKEMPPLPHIIETPDGTKGISPPIETFERPPLPRLFFINSKQDQLVQVQDDRFHQNWRKLKEKDAYPRYQTLYPEFKKSWETFKSFVRESGLGTPSPDQYELTYVNQLPQGQGWTCLVDIGNIFKDFQCKIDGRFLPEPESVDWRRIYRLGNEMGRVHVSLKTALTKEAKKIMVFELTVRGFSKGPMDEWFSLAHEWIVKGFADLTTDRIQKELWHQK